MTRQFGAASRQQDTLDVISARGGSEEFNRPLNFRADWVGVFNKTHPEFIALKLIPPGGTLNFDPLRLIKGDTELIGQRFRNLISAQCEITGKDGCVSPDDVYIGYARTDVDERNNVIFLKVIILLIYRFQRKGIHIHDDNIQSSCRSAPV